MTKAELELRVRELEEERDALADSLVGYEEAYGELENRCAELTQNNDQYVGIVDVEHFRSRLAMDGLYSAELEQFIDEYLRFYNE